MNPKVPPHSIEAEQSTLGAMMVDNRRIDDVLEQVSEGDFYRRDHQVIFRAILGAMAERKSADFVTVSEWLRSRDLLERPGEQGGEVSFAYLGSIAADCPTAANASHYAGIVRDKSMLREVIAIGTNAADLGYNATDKPLEQVLDQIERSVFSIRERGAKQRSGPVDMAQLAELADRGIKLRSESKGISGISTGIADLDRMTTGLHPGDLVILAGRPSMGKTSLALNIAEHCAINQGKWTGVFSMEMPGEQLAMRLMASQTGVPLQAMRSGEMTRDYWDRIGDHGGMIRQAKIWVDDTGALSPNDLRARARRRATRDPLGLLVVDYIQLMQVPGTRENRTNEVSEISRNLKALAKELKVPIIALSQLNRGLESRDNKRPRMSDLRESGGIEQDADLVLMIYRDEVYHPDSPCKGTAEIIIGKQRNGPLGMVRAAFLGEYCRFENLAHGWSMPEIEAPKRKTRGFGMSHAAHAIGYDA